VSGQSAKCAKLENTKKVLAPKIYSMIRRHQTASQMAHHLTTAFCLQVEEIYADVIPSKTKWVF